MFLFLFLRLFLHKVQREIKKSRNEKEIETIGERLGIRYEYFKRGTS